MRLDVVEIDPCAASWQQAATRPWTRTRMGRAVEPCPGASRHTCNDTAQPWEADPQLPDERCPPATTPACLPACRLRPSLRVSQPRTHPAPLRRSVFFCSTGERDKQFARRPTHLAHPSPTHRAHRHVQPPRWLRWPLQGDAQHHLPKVPAEGPLQLRVHRLRPGAPVQAAALPHPAAPQPIPQAETHRGRTQRPAAQEGPR